VFELLTLTSNTHTHTCIGFFLNTARRQPDGSYRTLMEVHTRTIAPLVGPSPVQTIDTHHVHAAQ
jgi:hypothetical protein